MPMYETTVTTNSVVINEAFVKISFENGRDVLKYIYNF